MLANYKAKSGRFIPVWTLEIQTLPRDTDKILNAAHTFGQPAVFECRNHCNTCLASVGRVWYLRLEDEFSNEPLKRVPALSAVFCCLRAHEKCAELDVL